MLRIILHNIGMNIFLSDRPSPTVPRTKEIIDKTNKTLLRKINGVYQKEKLKRYKTL